MSTGKDSQDLLQQHLLTNEQVLWSSPAPKQFLFTSYYLIAYLFTMLFGLGGASFFTAAFLQSIDGVNDFLLARVTILLLLVVFLGIGLYFLFILFQDWRFRQQRLYVVTNHRLMIISPGSKHSFKAIEHGEKYQPELIRHRFHHASVMMKAERERATRAPDFECIPDAEEVVRLIAQLKKEPKIGHLPGPGISPIDESIQVTQSDLPNLSHILKEKEKLLHYQRPKLRSPLSILGYIFVTVGFIWSSFFILSILSSFLFLAAGEISFFDWAMSNAGSLIFLCFGLLVMLVPIQDYRYRKQGHVIITNQRIIKAFTKHIKIKDSIEHRDLDEIRTKLTPDGKGTLYIDRKSDSHKEDRLTMQLEGLSFGQQAYRILVEQKMLHAK